MHKRRWSRLGSWTSGLFPPAQELSSWKEGFKLLCLNFSLSVKNLHGDLMTTLIPVFHPYSSWVSTLLSLHLVKVMPIHIAEGGQSRADTDI